MRLLTPECSSTSLGGWWLARQGRFEEAEKTITLCARPGFYEEREAAGFVAFMVHTDALEKIESANGSWKEMFIGVNRRRTEIVSFSELVSGHPPCSSLEQMLGVWGVQLWNGNIITGLTVEL